MRKISLFFILSLFLPSMVFADGEVYKNDLLISPLGLVAGNYGKIRVRYQRDVSEVTSIGLDAKYYYGKFYPGYQVNPFFKYLPKSLNGFYFYGSGLLGRTRRLPDDFNKYYTLAGGGFGVGAQLFFGKKKNGVIDVSGGLKLVRTNANLRVSKVPEGYDDFYIIGPAAFFDSILAIGFRF